MTATCALCGFRDASTTTDYDYEDHRGVREVPACGVCLEPPSVPPEWTYEPTADEQTRCVEYSKPSRAAIAAFIADAGEATALDVLKRFGVAPKTKGYSTVTMFLSRMKRDGELVARKSGGAGGHQSALIYSEGVAKVRRHLPQRPRSEVVALARRGKTAKEIAHELGMNVPAVKVALCTARNKGEIARAA